MQKILLLFLMLALLGAATTATATDPKAPVDVYVISIGGEVDPGMAAYLRRSLQEVPADTNTRIVLEIDTFGGRVDSALDMVDTLLHEAPAETVAYVKTKAISAGALIALACRTLVMRNGTTLGDCAPISYSSEGPRELGEKFQSPLRAKFRALAKRNGHPEVLAEAMVTADMEVYEVRLNGDERRFLEARDLEGLSEEERGRIQSKRVVVAEGELLTMDDVEARELGFSAMSVTDLDELLQTRFPEGYRLVRIEESWSEGLVGFLSSIAPILMLIGLGALYTEIKSPGFGLPGIVGILCLAAVFLNQYLVGLADYTELLLFSVGLALLGVELFVIPGFGLAGIAGIVLLAVGVLLALQDFVVPDPALPWQGELLIHNGVLVLGAFVGAFFLSLFLLRYALPRFSRVVEGPYLDATLEDAHAEARDARRVTLGERGTAATPLHPAGKMKTGTELLDVVTQGEFIAKGTPVRVLRIDGNMVIVAREGEYGE